MKKAQAIDVLKLIVDWQPKEWNDFLTRRDRANDIHGLTETLVGIQKGMDKLAKQGLNTDMIAETFLRMQRSIENTLKKIYRRQNPNLLYDPLYKNEFGAELIADKKRLDLNFELFLKKNRY